IFPLHRLFSMYQFTSDSYNLILCLQINIPYGRPTEFSIQSAKGAQYNLKPAKSSP
uniref:Uncharacterized protein n=1 Tax=Aegilops tauschii subsp. strangulata TaxID=200361 RepID=A0A453SXE3_AEGTS